MPKRTDKQFPAWPAKPWPAVPTPTREELLKGVSEAAAEYTIWLEDNVAQKYNFNKPEMLSRLRVLQVSNHDRHLGVQAHWCVSQLAELGAEAIQVEPPGGDPIRRNTPFGRKEYMIKDNETGEAVGLRYLHEARNKQSITLNLSKPEGQEIFKSLAKHVDIIVENGAPGYFDSLGIGYRQLSEINPRLVYAWVGNRGQWGPLKDHPNSHDILAQSACGFVHGTGAPPAFGGRPTRSGYWMCDQVGGTAAALGIMAATHYRERVSGRGQFVEAAGAEAIIRILDYNWGWQGMDGSIRPRYGNWDLAINIYAVNPCKDGYIMVGGGHDRLWYRIWRTVGKDKPELEKHIIEDPKLREVVNRLPHDMQVETYTALTDWTKDNTRAESEGKLQAEEVASGGVLFTDEVCEYHHYKYRGHVQEVDDVFYGKVLIGATPLIGQKTPGRVKWLGRPTGWDNDDVYRRLLGFNKDTLKRLRKEGVI